MKKIYYMVTFKENQAKTANHNQSSHLHIPGIEVIQPSFFAQSGKLSNYLSHPNILFKSIKMPTLTLFG